MKIHFARYEGEIPGCWVAFVHDGPCCFAWALWNPASGWIIPLSEEVTGPFWTATEKVAAKRHYQECVNREWLRVLGEMMLTP